MCPRFRDFGMLFQRHPDPLFVMAARSTTQGRMSTTRAASPSRKSGTVCGGIPRTFAGVCVAARNAASRDMPARISLAITIGRVTG